MSDNTDKKINIEAEEQSVNTHEEKEIEQSQPEETTNEETESTDEETDWKDKYIRLFAEFENYKKRTLKEKAELLLNGSEKTIAVILPVLDDFERALADNTDDPKAIKEGFDLIFKKFVKTLEGIGVEKIKTEDQDFNVNFHEAIAMVPGVDDDKKGKVIDCVQTGYMLNDKVIRHAKVAVGK